MKDYGPRSGAFCRDQAASEAYWERLRFGAERPAPHPAPLVSAEHVIDPFGDVRVGRGVRAVLRAAERAGWQYVVHYAKGTTLGAKGQTATERVIHRKDKDVFIDPIKESVVVRLRKKDDYTETWVYAVAVWLNNKFDVAYRTPRGSDEGARVDADGLKEFICQGSSVSSAERR